MRLKKAIAAGAALMGGALVVVVLVAQFSSLPGEQVTPSGEQRNQSLYVTADDGTAIAIDVWLPESLAAGETVPALIAGTRYWRAQRVTPLGRLLHWLGMAAPGVLPGEYPAFFNPRGYAVVTVDVRGTGASYGVHRMEYSPTEIADYRAVIDWIVSRGWSNGKVGALGVSYVGTSAELMTTVQHPALKAVAPLYSDFDAQYHLATPGGIYQPGFIAAWSDAVSAMDRNDVCALAWPGASGWLAALRCRLAGHLYGGVKPVDGDARGARLAQAVAQHNTPDVQQAVRELEFRDSPYADTPWTMADSQAYARRADIERSGVPMFVIAGWLDAATADGALARYTHFSNPQSLILAPFSHGGDHDTDPFADIHRPPLWSFDEHYGAVEAFFAYYLKGRGAPPVEGIRYHIMNGGGWRFSEVWPPLQRDRWDYYLAGDQRLQPKTPVVNGSQSLAVDFTASTGLQTRWHTQLGGPDVVYTNRIDQAGKVLRFQGEPLARDIEVVGNVQLSLYLSASVADPNLHVYLESVGPDGRVTYVTEGVLRAIHRKGVDVDVPYRVDGAGRSYLRRHAQPLVPGEVARIDMTLYVTAMRLTEGSRLQVALAGADTGAFESRNIDHQPRLTLYHGPDYPSRISLPVMVGDMPAGSAQRVLR
ncbi:CocE/NonD family hydrolase [Parahaliea mediterranea]|uniref:CocE/NonD family hydrolase n=1 Tax=Parahaliea mediterranea TaxID=651086 RepID=UPI00130024F3|nr:CocE/NonD family hydrolase [Parahaliea mediterranea]